VVKNGSGVMAVAVIDASGLDCVSGNHIEEKGTAHVDIVPVPLDNADAAVRLAIRHLDAPPADTATLDACFSRVALLMVGQHCDGAGCETALSTAMSAAVAAAKSSFDPATGAWDVSIQVPSGPSLHVARGMLQPNDITLREADGVTSAFVPLFVNGSVVPLLP
jgi:hypothetical protein